MTLTPMKKLRESLDLCLSLTGIGQMNLYVEASHDD